MTDVRGGRQLRVFFLAVRGVFLLAVSVFLLMLVLTLILRGQQPPAEVAEEAALSNEHRMTALETRTDLMAGDIKDMKTYLWGLLFGVAGLTGEAGLRLVRKSHEE